MSYSAMGNTNFRLCTYDGSDRCWDYYCKLRKAKVGTSQYQGSLYLAIRDKFLGNCPSVHMLRLSRSIRPRARRRSRRRGLRGLGQEEQLTSEEFTGRLGRGALGAVSGGALWYAIGKGDDAWKGAAFGMFLGML